jgi:hypothetical protein
MRMQIHQDSGLDMIETESKAILYQDRLENALADAGISDFVWPDPQILRVFQLKDGRLAMSRETEYGLEQSAAPLIFGELFSQFETQLEAMQTAQTTRQALENEAL